MKTKLAAGLSALALTVPVADAVAATRATSKSASSTSPAKKTVATRKVIGTSAEADRWGSVQVTVTAKITTAANGKKTIKYTDLGGNYSYHTDRSQFIMSQSLPLPRQE